MSDAVLWNLKATLLIVSSLRRYVDLRFPYLLWPFVDQVLNNLEEGLEQYKNFLNPLSRNLDEILAWNRWAISCKNIDLLNLKIQERLCCGGEILIIKSYSQNVSAVVKEAQYTYFLVSALSCNGSVVYIWKDGAWKRESSDSSYSNNFYELYYFYYCKITPKSISKLLRLDDVCNTNDSLFQVMIKTWNFTKESKNIFDFDGEIEARMEYSGIIEKINKEKEDAQAEIARLESNNKKLESDIKKYKEYIEEYKRNESNLKNLNYSWEEKCKSLDNEHQKLMKITKEKEESSNEAIKLLNQKIIDMQNEKHILEAEKFYLKNFLSEKENLLQKTSDEHHKISEKYNILQEKCKNLKEKLNKANYSQILYNPENEIVQLPPNTKHGLPNLGNTCYLNSLLQIFASTPLFVSKIASIDSPFCNSLSSLLSNMHIENSSKTISNLTRNFSKNLMEAYSNIKEHTQQDVKEVFNMILSKIEEEGGSFNIFSIVFHQVFSCLNLHKSTYDDTQTFLIIPPQHKNAQDNYLRNQSYYYRSTQSLFCNDCNRKIDMSIELKGVNWPEYLVLYFPTPPNSIVESLWINNENSYEIYGVICYYHNEGSFHYTAFTKDGNIWNEYNDKYVGTKAIDPHFVNLAFYSKKVVLSQNMIAEKPYQSHFYNS